MTNDALRAHLLADPDTADLAAEQGMTVMQYVEETVAYCDAPERGFAGTVDAPDAEADDAQAVPGPAAGSAFEHCARPTLPRHEPGLGAEGRLPAFRARVVRG